MSSLDQRCPRCGAFVRAGTEWCTLCHVDLRPAPEPVPEPDPEPELVAAGQTGVDALTAPLAQVLATTTLVQAGPALTASAPESSPVAPVRTGGKHAKPSAAPAPARASVDNDATEAALAAVGLTLPEDYDDFADVLVDVDHTDVAFALLRAESRDPLLSKLEGSLSAPGARAGLIIGGAVVIAITLFAVAAVLGAIFH